MGEKGGHRVSTEPRGGTASCPASSPSQHGQHWPRHIKTLSRTVASEFPCSRPCAHALCVSCPQLTQARPGPTSPLCPPPRPLSLPQGLGTWDAFCLGYSALGLLMAGFFPSLRSRLDCHLLREAFSNHPIWKHPPTTSSVFLAFFTIRTHLASGSSARF